jgi:hypothetical protein
MSRLKELVTKCLMNHPNYGQLSADAINASLSVEEVTEARYYEMLNVLPPERMRGGAFLVGEPFNHNAAGEPRFDYFYQKDGRYYYGGLLTTREFDTLYEAELSNRGSTGGGFAQGLCVNCDKPLIKGRCEKCN